MSQVPNGLQDVLQIIDLCHAGATEVILRDGICGESPLPEIELQLASFRKQAAEGERSGGNATCIASVTASLA
jgi:hypothetical protein